MANTKNHAYLSDQQLLIFTIGLCETLSEASAATHIADILLKLLTPQELRMLIVRLQIQKMLIEKTSYALIKEDLHVSSGTISRVKLLLEQAGVRPTNRLDTENKENVALAIVPYSASKAGYSRAKGPLDKYSYAAWPVEFLGLLIKGLLDKQKPP